MSSEARPIPASQFSLAIQDLAIENLYSKAHEINNSILHLENSNQQLQEYSDSIRADSSLPASTREEGDKDCLDAIRENKVVIERQQERVELLKREVERRGARWHGGAGTRGGGRGDSTTNGGGGEGNGDADQTTESTATMTAEQGSQATGGNGGRLTDEELRRQMMDRMADEDGDDDSANGLHL